jgi:hypothetical protein
MKLMSPKEAILENPLSIFEFVAHGEVVYFLWVTAGLFIKPNKQMLEASGKKKKSHIKKAPHLK